MYLIREKNGKENWGPKVFSPDSPNCYLPNLKSKWRGKKIPLGDTKLPCATNVHSHFVQFFFFFSRLFILNCPIFFVPFFSFLFFFFFWCTFHPFFLSYVVFFFFNPFFSSFILDFCSLSLSLSMKCTPFFLIEV